MINVYKVVRYDRSQMVRLSVSPPGRLELIYPIGEPCYPEVGMLFAFSEYMAARKFAGKWYPEGYDHEVWLASTDRMYDCRYRAPTMCSYINYHAWWKDMLWARKVYPSYDKQIIPPNKTVVAPWLRLDECLWSTRYIDKEKTYATG